MLPSSNSVGWMEQEQGEDDETVSWYRNNHQVDTTCKEDDDMNMTTLKSMLETDCYINSHFFPNPTLDNLFSASQPFTLDLSHSHSLLNNTNTNTTFDTCFDLACENNFVPNHHTPNPSLFNCFNTGISELTSVPDFPNNPVGFNFTPIGFDAGTATSNSNSQFPNRSKVLRPLEIFPPLGEQPTLFQKRAAAALRQGDLGFTAFKRKRNDEDEVEVEVEGTSINGSGLNYESDEPSENANNGNKFNAGKGRTCCLSR